MSESSAGISAYFSTDHRACDDGWGEFEEALEREDPVAALAAWNRFHSKMERHFAMEEEVLFPAIGEATGMGKGGPIAVMLHEHTQMRALLSQMARTAAGDDLFSVQDQGDTLLMIIQQHNAKEEGILYPLADRALGAKWPELLTTLSKR